MAKNPLNAGLADVMHLEAEDIVASTEQINEPVTIDPAHPDPQNPQATAQPPVPPAGQDPAPAPAEPPKEKPKAEPIKDLADLSFDALELPGEAPEAPPAEAPPEISEADLDAVEASISSEQQKAAYIHMRQKIVQLERQVNEAKPAEVDTAETESLRQQLEEAHDMIGKMNLEQHPKFKSKYGIPKQQKQEQAAKYAIAAGADEAVIAVALGKDLAGRAEYLREEVGDYAPTILTLLADVDVLDAQRDAELAQWRESSQEIQAHESERRSLIQHETARQSFNETMSLLKNDDFLPYVHIDGNEPWNKNVDLLQAAALELFMRDDPVAQQKAMAQGIAAKPLLNAYLAERKKAQNYAEQLRRIGGSVPSLSGSSSPTTQPQVEMPSEMSPKEAAAYAGNKLRAS